MKKTTALWTLTLLVSLSSGATAAEARKPLRPLRRSDSREPHGGATPGGGKGPQWKSREEYDAFNAMATEKDPNKKIALAEAFLQKYANSDFKDQAYLMEMQTYQQTNQTDKALDAGQKALRGRS